MTSEEEAYDELRCYTLALQDPSFIHQHVVDAFTVQHANEQTKPIVISFALVGLHLFLARRFSGRQVQRAHMQLASRKGAWSLFTLPFERGTLTAAHVMAAPEGRGRERAIHAWCTSVWEAFHDSHQAVADLLQQHGFGYRPGNNCDSP